jgi:predicted GTPase
VIIMGAAGRDFHDFNVAFRGAKGARVVAFTAAQIPDIAGRAYPRALSGPLYPRGIPIFEEGELPRLIKELAVDLVVFAYSDVSHEEVMHKASIALAAGADFELMGPASTALKARKPVISVCAVRTGCGKSQTTRAIVGVLREAGMRVVAVRHPMPYGDLAKQAVQRFARRGDLDLHRCTIEEREEFEPHIEQGAVVYSGVDYEKILRRAEREADVIVWDGGNNDLPFFASDLHIVIADALRPGHELLYHPGEANLRAADIVIINKVERAAKGAVEAIARNVGEANPRALLLTSTSPASIDGGEAQLKGKRVLVVEDGPTTTHGGMGYGAGLVAAERVPGVTIVDPRPHAVGSIRALYAKYAHLGRVVPAMGYSPAQVRELEATINGAGADAVVAGTPIDLARVVKAKVPIVRVRYGCPPELVKRLRPLPRPCRCAQARPVGSPALT